MLMRDNPEIIVLQGTLFRLYLLQIASCIVAVPNHHLWCKVQRVAPMETLLALFTTQCGRQMMPCKDSNEAPPTCMQSAALETSAGAITC